MPSLRLLYEFPRSLFLLTSEFVKEETERANVMAQLKLHGWTWRSCGAAIGLGGGILVAVFGCVVTVIAWFTAEWHGFHLQRDGTALLFLTIPLLIFGAHCLDLLDKQRPAIKSVNRSPKEGM